MTPERLAQLRAEAITVDVREIADALTAAWASIADAIDDRELIARECRQERERAERAETEAHTARIQRDNAMADYIRCDDALARVRALCDEEDFEPSCMCCVPVVDVADVRAAIEGGSQ